MKKEILLSTILCFSLANSALAEDLEEITVQTATKTNKSIDGVAASVIVISQKEIEKIGAVSLKDIINKAAGLNVQYGTFPNASSKSKSSISIRGMGANGTVFLLDGRRLAGEVRNPYDLERIAASTIERIEIVKGPMSTLYGADAVGGVVNIITKKATDKLLVNLDFKYGQNSHGDAKNKNVAMDIRGKESKLRYSLYLNKTNTTPYTQNETANTMVKAPKTLNPADGSKTYQKVKPSMLATPTLPNGNPLPVNPNTQGLLNAVNFLNTNLQDSYTQDVTYREDSDINTIGTRLDYDISDNTTIGLDVNAFEEERNGSYIGYFHPSKFSMPVFNIPVESKDENKRIDLGVDLTTNINEDILLKLRAYSSKYKKRNSTTVIYYQDLAYASKAESVSNSLNGNADVMTYETTLNYAVNDNHFLTMGAEYREEKRESTIFDNTPNMTKQDVNYKSAYLQDEWQINDSLNAIIGARYDNVSNADNKATLKLGVVKNFSKLANVRAIFAQGYRTPDLKELYINKNTPAGLQQGSEIVGYDLKPEFTNSYEFGLSGRNTKFSYDLAFFFNNIEDRISQETVTDKITFINIDEASTQGIELSLAYNISDKLSTNFSYIELKTEDKKTKQDLEFNPERTASLGFDYQALKDLNLSTSIKYVGKQMYSETKNNIKTTKEANDFTLVDVNASYQVNKNLNLYGGVNNIFDEKVDDILGSNVGTYYFLGARVNF